MPKSKPQFTRIVILAMMAMLMQACATDDTFESLAEAEQEDPTSPEVQAQRIPPSGGDNPSYWCHDTCIATSRCSRVCDEYPIGLSTCGHYGVCNDLDGDGVYYPQDNCEHVYNPNQANCDGDGAGDACDSMNATSSTVSVQTYVQSYLNSNVATCSKYMRYWEALTDRYWVEDKTTTVYCGPEANKGTVVSYSNGRNKDLFVCHYLVGTCPAGSSWEDPPPPRC